jgi:general secretion pathway protein E
MLASLSAGTLNASAQDRSTDDTRSTQGGPLMSAVPSTQSAGAAISTPEPPTAIDLLCRTGRLSLEALERARRSAVEAGEPVETALTKLGLVGERDLAEAFGAALGLSVLGAAALPQTELPLPAISEKFLRYFRVLPVAMGAGAVDLAMAFPLDEYAVKAVGLFAGLPIRRLVATQGDIDAALDRLFRAVEDEPSSIAAEPDDDVERLRDLASDAPVIRLVNQLIVRAVETGASDLHIEPAVDRLIIRLRIDGQMREIEAPPLKLRDAVVSRVKIMAKLNIAERRLPQDGRLSFSVRGAEIDFRVATTPTIHGESVVIRVLDQSRLSLDFDVLGFDAMALDRYQALLAQPHGILLVTGPTGSGKTTTLYASLAALNTPERKIMTIEDPVEYQLDRINQVQVQSQIGLTFARALRSFLRQNPNIIMVGEIRDLETAQIAVQAALTGHMILSTLHTNDAATGITRLLDMGVEDYLLTSTVNGIVAQRLVRRLCLACRQPYEALPGFTQRLGLTLDRAVTLHRAVGCPDCGGTGYQGRTTIIEILAVTDGLRRLILDHAPATELQRLAIAEGMRSMQQHGLAKALAGITTIEEVLSAAREA